MIETIRNARKIPELRKKILFTVFALLIFRLGSVVPVPFIDSNMLGATLNNMGGIFTLLGAMNGTAFSMAAVFALGVQRISTVLLSSSSSPLPSLPWSGSRRRAARRAGRRLRPLPAMSPWPSACCRASATTPDPHPGRRNDAGHRRPAWLVGGYRHRTVLHCRLRLCHVAG